MESNELKRLKEEYMKTPIPEELEFIIRNAFDNKMKKDGKEKKRKKLSIEYKWVGGLVATIVAFIMILNMNTAFANALSEIPIVGKIIKVFTAREYKLDEDTYNADIKAPEIDGFENKELQDKLNEKYLEENKKLYDEFIEDIEELKKNGGGHMGVDSGYVIKTDNERILSIGRYVVNTVASSSTAFQYDTIDKENEILITLPSLFKDEGYIEVISQNIKEQMRKEMREDENKIYWVGDSGLEETVELFERISKDQSFYINKDYKLVISFDKYEVAPGYMGIAEFILPTGLIQDLLISNEYIN